MLIDTNPLLQNRNKNENEVKVLKKICKKCVKSLEKPLT